MTKNSYTYCIVGALLIAFEYFLFKSYIQVNVIPFYPNVFDQAGILNKIYFAYESILNRHEMRTALFSTMTAGSSIFGLQTILAFIVFGASRTTALTLNFLFFIVLQIYSYYTVYKITQRKNLALLFVGLILCVGTPFFYAGSMVDFRMDFMTFCVYGLLVNSIILSQVLLDKKWSLISGGIATYLILLRTVTAVYLLGIGGVLLFLFFFQKNTRARIKNLFLFSMPIIFVCLPMIFILMKKIYHYYVVGHVISEEKYIRAAENNVHSLRDNLLFYPHSIAYDHVTHFAAIIAICLMVGAVIVALWHKVFLAIPHYTLTLFFIVISILVPLCCLTLDQAKSPVVGSITVVPVLWCMFWIFYYLVGDISSACEKLVSFIAAVVISCGAFNYVNHYTRHSIVYHVNNVTGINKMYTDIGDYLLTHEIKNPLISVDEISDFLSYAAINDLYYEKNHQFLNLQGTILGTTIFNVSQNDAIDAIKKSDIYIANEHAAPQDHYPFTVSMKKLKPILHQFANKEMVLLKKYHFANSTYDVYVQRVTNRQM